MLRIIFKRIPNPYSPPRLPSDFLPLYQGVDIGLVVWTIYEPVTTGPGVTVTAGGVVHRCVPDNTFDIVVNCPFPSVETVTHSVFVTVVVVNDFGLLVVGEGEGLGAGVSVGGGVGFCP